MGLCFELLDSGARAPAVQKYLYWPTSREETGLADEHRAIWTQVNGTCKFHTSAGGFVVTDWAQRRSSSHFPCKTQA